MRLYTPRSKINDCTFDKQNHWIFKSSLPITYVFNYIVICTGQALPWMRRTTRVYPSHHQLWARYPLIIHVKSITKESSKILDAIVGVKIFLLEKEMDTPLKTTRGDSNLLSGPWIQSKENDQCKENL